MATRPTESNPPRPTHPIGEPQLRRQGPQAEGSAGFEEALARARRIAALIERRALLFFGTFLATAALVLSAVLLQTPLYESTALLLVKFGRELVYQLDVGEARSIAHRDKQTVINSELAILRSDPVIEGVVQGLGIETLFPDLAEEMLELQSEVHEAAGGGGGEGFSLLPVAAEQFRELLVVQALPNADVLRISFRHPDPVVAARAVNVLVERFTEAHLSAFGEPEIVLFLDQRVAKYKDRLDVAESALRGFEVEHPVFALEAPSTVLVNRLDSIRADLEAVDEQVSSIALSVVSDDSARAQAQRELLALELDQSKLRGNLRDDGARRIQVVNRFIAERKSEVDTGLQRLGQKRAQLEQAHQKLEIEFAQLPNLSTRNRELRRERDAFEEQYSTYLKRLRDARLSHEMDAEKIASINVIQSAAPSPEPIWPLRRELALALGLLIAVAVAGLVATLVDTLGLGSTRRQPRYAPAALGAR